MTLTQSEFDGFWNQLDRDLASVPLELSLEQDSFYSQPEWAVYQVRYNSLAGYRLFAWLSVPSGSKRDKVPAVLRMPDFASVHDIIYTPLRQDAMVMNATHRGQRNSDDSYQARYPGLLTDGIDCTENYVMRLVFGDALRGVDALLAQREVPLGPVALMGSGLGATLALAAAARRPAIIAVAADTPLVLGHPGELVQAPAYPLAELTDYLSQNPQLEENVAVSSGPLDPLIMAPLVPQPVLLSLGRRDRGLCPFAIGEVLAARLPQCDLRVYDGGSEGGGHEHKLVREDWLRQHLGICSGTDHA